jgi:hypothetical protein
MTPGRRGSVLLRVGGELRHLPQSVVVRFAPLQACARVPGAPPALHGITEVSGEVMAVLAAGPVSTSAPMIVCTWAGEHVGVAGAEIVGVGTYDVPETAPDCVEIDGEWVRPLDLAALCARAQPAPWTGRTS